MYIYHALINALCAHMVHNNLNTIFNIHVEHSPTKTIYIYKVLCMDTHTHTHNHSNRNWVLSIDISCSRNTVRRGRFSGRPVPNFSETRSSSCSCVCVSSCGIVASHICACVYACTQCVDVVMSHALSQ